MMDYQEFKDEVKDNIKAFLNGTPQNVVSK